MNKKFLQALSVNFDLNSLKFSFKIPKIRKNITIFIYV